MSKGFNDFRFAGLNHRSFSNSYMTMNRVNDDDSRIVVRVADCHLFQSKYGYGLIIDRNHIVWLKDWAVDENYYGNEVVLTKEFFAVKESTKEFEDFDNYDESVLTWEHWLSVAKAQQKAGTAVKWSK